jgi:hypothetical protein
MLSRTGKKAETEEDLLPERDYDGARAWPGM